MVESDLDVCFFQQFFDFANTVKRKSVDFGFVDYFPWVHGVGVHDHAHNTFALWGDALVKRLAFVHVAALSAYGRHVCLRDGLLNRRLCLILQRALHGAALLGRELRRKLCLPKLHVCNGLRELVASRPWLRLASSVKVFGPVQAALLGH